jgi:hypothetical protein
MADRAKQQEEQSMAKKLHPADLADIEQGRRAVGYNVHLRLGALNKINRGASTLAAAMQIADELAGHNSGRRPIIYAILPEGQSIPVHAALLNEQRAQAAPAQEAHRPKVFAKRFNAQRAADNATKALPAHERQKIAMQIVPAGKGVYTVRADNVLAVPFAPETLALLAERGIEAGKHAAPAPKPPVADLVKERGEQALATLAADADSKISKMAKALGGALAALDAPKQDAPKAPKTATVAEIVKPAPKPRAAIAAAMEAAERGVMPTPPDFNKPAHVGYRKRLQALVDMAEAGDLDGLQATVIETKCSSRVLLARYRDLAVRALIAKAEQAA